MRIHLILVLFVLAIQANAQFEIEDYYPPTQLQKNLELAKTPKEKMFALGVLGRYYCKLGFDSLVPGYLQQIKDIGSISMDKEMEAEALWWEAYIDFEPVRQEVDNSHINKTETLLSFAEKNNLDYYKILASRSLAEIYIHKNLERAEHFALASNLHLGNLKPGFLKDSLEVEINGTFAHVYIHKKDGVNAARHLLKVKDKAEQDKFIAIKVAALKILASMYSESSTEKSLPYLYELENHYKLTRQPNRRAEILAVLVMATANTGNKTAAINYLKAFESLQDSLGIYPHINYWEISWKQFLGMITTEQLAHHWETNFNGRIILKPKDLYEKKASLYFELNKLDSVEIYLDKARMASQDPKNYYNNIYANFYLAKKDYGKAIAEGLRKLKRGETGNDPNSVRSALRFLSRVYKEKEDYKNANEYLVKYYNLKDSLEKLNNKEEIALMQVQKDKEIELRKEKERLEEKNRANNLQYMGMSIVAASILLVLLLLGLVKAKPWLIRVMNFFSFIFIFEFIILLADHQIHAFTNGDLWKILLIKIGLIAILYPLHHLIEKRVSHALINKKISLASGIKRLKKIKTSILSEGKDEKA